MKIQFLFKWYDLWIGFFYDKKKNWIYFLPIPAIGIIIKLPQKQVKKLNIPVVINQVCDCIIPDYDDAAGTWCRKCNAKIL